MKATYPIVLIPDTNGYTVYIPDFDIYTQGADLNEAIFMSCDAIDLVVVDMKENGKEIPLPRSVNDIKLKDGESLHFVEIDFAF